MDHDSQNHENGCSLEQFYELTLTFYGTASIHMAARPYECYDVFSNSISMRIVDHSHGILAQGIFLLVQSLVHHSYCLALLLEQCHFCRLQCIPHTYPHWDHWFLLADHLHQYRWYNILNNKVRMLVFRMESILAAAVNYYLNIPMHRMFVVQ